jgi:predicted ABC-type sugar transport system permease subunit
VRQFLGRHVCRQQRFRLVRVGDRVDLGEPVQPDPVRDGGAETTGRGGQRGRGGDLAGHGELGPVRFGRYVYAIGGNAEAARRAGINLTGIRVAAFTLCGLTAGIMGIIYASYLGSVSTGVQGGNNVLYAVAAAVIGGTSLFGGRGKMLGAVIGGVIVAVIYNGLELLGLGASSQNIWTAVVFLAAVTVDTLARRSRSTT